MVLYILVRLVAAAPAGGWHFSLICGRQCITLSFEFSTHTSLTQVACTSRMTESAQITNHGASIRGEYNSNVTSRFDGIA